MKFALLNVLFHLFFFSDRPQSGSPTAFPLITTCIASNREEREKNEVESIVQRSNQAGGKSKTKQVIFGIPKTS